MAKSSVVSQSISPSFGESVGINIREVIDAEPAVLRGYRAASDESLVEARAIVNAQRRAQLTAKLMADLKG
jgi:hypothetical protein